MAITPPNKKWYNVPLGKDERIWSYIMIVMLLMMGLMAVGWVFVGNQNPPEDYRQFETTEEYYEIATNGNDESGVSLTTLDELDTNPQVLRQVTGGDIYMVAQQWNWVAPSSVGITDGFQIKVDTKYRLHLGSIDVLHGFQLIGTDFLLAIQVVPGYDYIVEFIPNETGLFRIICNEFCGPQHHEMQGFLNVVEA